MPDFIVQILGLQQFVGPEDDAVEPEVEQKREKFEAENQSTGFG